MLEAAPDAMVVVNQAGDIVLLNLQAEKQFGYRRDELVGQPVTNIIPEGFAERLIADDLRSAADALAQQIGTGIELSGRRKDGTEFPIEIMLSPLESAEGILVTAAIRDISGRKAAEEHLAQMEGRSVQVARQRAMIAETLRGLRPGDTPEATAQAICRHVMSLSGVTAAQIFIFELDGRANPISFTVAGQPDPPLRRLPLQRSQHLHDRAAEGPWIEPWSPKPGHPYDELLTGLGVHLVAYAPVRFNSELIGLLVADAGESVTEAALAESLAGLVESADLAGALVGRDVAERTKAHGAREKIHNVIDRRAFGPVFQPILDLEKGRVVGYEGLTRFTDGVSPEVRFGEAAAVGLGPDLEKATLQAAVSAAKDLPRSAWLSLNVSPALIVAHQPLQSLLHGTRRHIVIEVTEHVAIPDYEAFRASVADLGPKTELAVDDAGAGFASLRHILELRPAFVKLDRSLIAGIDGDPVR
ncbi:MAG: EAL domain-containing protein, partial [Candidatus Limnocylindria bacterium]